MIGRAWTWISSIGAAVAGALAVWWRWRAEVNEDKAADARNREQQARARLEQRREAEQVNRQGAKATRKAREQAGKGERNALEEEW